MKRRTEAIMHLMISCIIPITIFFLTRYLFNLKWEMLYGFVIFMSGYVGVYILIKRQIASTDIAAMIIFVLPIIVVAGIILYIPTVIWFIIEIISNDDGEMIYKENGICRKEKQR